MTIAVDLGRKATKQANKTTDQKGKLLLNTCGILFYCRNGAKSTAIKRMQTVQGSLWFLFCLILFLTSQSTILQLCRRIQLILRCADPEMV